MNRLLNFLRRDDGPTAVEYAVLLALLIIAMVASINLVGDEIRGVSDDNINALNIILHDGI